MKTKQLFKPRPIATEGQEQAALFKWRDYNAGAYPELELLHHIPNGGKRDIVTATHLKAQGVQAGVPDISLPVPRAGFHGLFIELKVGSNKPSSKQQNWIDRLRNQGYCVEVCYGWVEAAAVIKDYLKGKTYGENRTDVAT
jgi:murein tripeptide amidase MpaA